VLLLQAPEEDLRSRLAAATQGEARRIALGLGPDARRITLNNL
jgi:hypothetical protein